MVVELFRNGSSVLTTTTDVSGAYTFTGFAPGDFRVEFTAPSTYTFTYQNQGADDTVDSDPDRSTGLTAAYSLASGEVNQTIDAGLFQPVTIGNLVWIDSNVNGIQDEVDTGLENVSIELFNSGDVLQGTTTSDANGYYTFTGMVEGSYYVVFTLPINSFFAPQNQGGDDTLDSDADPSTGRTQTVILTAGQTDLTLDAGIYNHAAIGNRVWVDSNANGIQDIGETGLSGIDIELFDSGDVSQGTTTTDVNGFYTFTELTPGSYYLVFTATNSYTFTLQYQGVDPQYDSDPDPATGRTQTTVLLSGMNDMSQDAGLYQTASVGNFVWNDSNGNGIQDVYEAAVSGVGVELFDSYDTSMGTTSTDLNGYYTFTDLTPGEYYLVFSAPDMVYFTTQSAGSNQTVDSNADLITGKTSNFTLVSGQVDTTQDAGLSQMDYGDLQSSYNLVLLTDDGARHTIGNLYLGTSIQAENGNGDLESNGASSAIDDNGVTRPADIKWQNGVDGGRVDVTSSGEGFLSAWIDFNNDHDFADSGEQILTDYPVITGTQPITFTITGASFPSSLFARFRLYNESTAGTALTNGYGGMGEVEDYAWDFGVTAIDLAYFQFAPADIPVARWVVLSGIIYLASLAWWKRRKHGK